MKKSERDAQRNLKNNGVHTSKNGGAHVDGDHDPKTVKTTSLQNLKDSINTFRKGR